MNIDYFIKQAGLLPSVVLKPHQIRAVQKTEDNDGQVLFNHGVGTGKTLTSVAAFENLKDKNKANRALVVVPGSLKENYLHNGVKKFTDSSGVIIGSTAEKNMPDTHLLVHAPEGKDYYIVGAELFRSRPEEIVDKIKPDTLIMDEIHKYKDPTSLGYNQIMKVRDKFKNAIGMTGSIVSNEPRDIIPPINIITNKKHDLGSYKDFNKQFTEEKETRTGLFGFFGNKTTTTNIKNSLKLKKELNRHIHSYNAIDKDMPTKTVTEVPVTMSPEQVSLYKYYLAQLDPGIKERIGNNLPIPHKDIDSTLASILKVRQLSNSMHSFRPDDLESLDKSTKAKKVIEDVHAHLQEHPDNKAIVYSNFVDSGVHVVAKGLANKGVEHRIFAGGSTISKQDRNQSVQDYLSGKARVIIINSAGAEGLNLPGTTAHFAMEGHFNPAMIRQSEARGIRSGSPVPEVNVRRYQSVLPQGHNINLLFPKTEHSIDQWIYSVAANKEKLNKSVEDLINQEDSPPKKLRFF